jgi:hypothetical protein
MMNALLIAVLLVSAPAPFQKTERATPQHHWRDKLGDKTYLCRLSSKTEVYDLLYVRLNKDGTVVCGGWRGTYKVVGAEILRIEIRAAEWEKASPGKDHDIFEIDLGTMTGSSISGLSGGAKILKFYEI